MVASSVRMAESAPFLGGESESVGKKLHDLQSWLWFFMLLRCYWFDVTVLIQLIVMICICCGFDEEGNMKHTK